MQDEETTRRRGNTLETGVFGDEVKYVFKRDSVTLNSDLTEMKDDDVIQWRFENTLIAEINVTVDRITVYDDVLDGRFRDRLKLDNQTGSLTITDITDEQTGSYTLEINSVKKKKVNVIIYGLTSVSGSEGYSYTLKSDLTEMKDDDVIQWRFRNTLIAEINKRFGRITVYDDVLDGRFRDRLKLDKQTGSLTITDITDEQTGSYTLAIDSVKKKKVNVRISGSVKSVKEGDSVTLNSDLTEIKYDDVIQWRLGNTLIAEINKRINRITVYDDVLDGRFRDRLKLDNQTGSLTITDIRDEHAGDYEREINFWKTKFFLAVFGSVKSVLEGDSATLNSDLTEIKYDDVIQWRFGNTLIAEINKRINRITVYDDVLDGRFRDRLKLDNQTGSLTITDIRDEHAGDYEQEINFWKTKFFLAVFDEISVWKGDSVTLNSDLTEMKRYDWIRWRFGPENTLIAEINKEFDRIAVYDDVLDGRFRDRLKLDKQTGSLTITNITTEHAGDYKLLMKKLRFSHSFSLKAFGVTVYAHLPVPFISRDCSSSSSSSCSLVCSAVNVSHVTLSWYKGNRLLSSISVFYHRVSLSLPLEVEYQDKNTYSCVINNPISNQTQHLNITQLCHTCSARLSVPVISRDCPSSSSSSLHNPIRNQTQHLNITQLCHTCSGCKTVSVKEGDSVTLNSDLTEMKDEDAIQWRFGNTLIAEINVTADRFTVYDDVLDGRFRDRLKLDNQTGSLTITDIRDEHTGLYERKINYLNTFFCLAVLVEISVKEGDSVTLNSDLTEMKDDDEIQWIFGNTLIAVINKRVDRITLFDYVLDGRFRDRLKLNKQTGSLTITDITTEHDGDYELKMWISNRYSLKEFRVSVYARLPVPVISRDCPSSSSSGSLLNPISNQTQHLNITQLCHTCSDSIHCCGPTEAVIRLVLSALVGVATVILLVYDIRSRRAERHQAHIHTSET
ncbi:CD48 antigen [Anabarilius grahami]|uniref:CD48 antigen n=1 Tax=Anabarilius grahami TaxID=495550 RepID=A0A3N0YRR7_ANAGA|nr:CD48 antigen [Anabarilius grahami]